MVFKKMLSAFGVGGPSVDTVLASPNTRPGLALDGQVNLVGGDHAPTSSRSSMGLVTRVEIEGGDSEYAATVEFHRMAVDGRPGSPRSSSSPSRSSCRCRGRPRSPTSTASACTA